MLDLIFIEYVKVVKTGVSKVYKRFKLKIRILKLIFPFSYLSSNIDESKYKILSPTKLMQGTWSQLILVDCIWFGFYFDFIFELIVIDYIIFISICCNLGSHYLNAPEKHWHIEWDK